ncbi:MAG: tetratricopeptide repeat protein [Candidatus Eisenbacteria bacterium]|nr:tetratricopeptide repeat protein [Candidatus Eisenbacteria bacterium]
MSLETRRAGGLADPGADFIDQFTGLWERHSRVILGAAGAILVVAAGTYFTLHSRALQEEQAAGKLAEANVLFWQGDYVRSLPLARQVSQQFGSTPSGQDAHRLAGDDAYWSGDFKAAVAEYGVYLEHQKTGLLADAARRSLAYALESDRQFDQARATYDQLVGVFDRESSAEFLTASARCLLQIKQPAEAARRLQRIIDEFGETSGAGRAREMIGELESH